MVEGVWEWDNCVLSIPRPDTLDPALMRPGRMDRKVEFGLPDLEVCMSGSFVQLLSPYTYPHTPTFTHTTLHLIHMTPTWHLLTSCLRYKHTHNIRTTYVMRLWGQPLGLGSSCRKHKSWPLNCYPHLGLSGIGS